MVAKKTKKKVAKKTARKKPGPPKGTGGRPKKPIDWPKVANMGKIHCTQSEIAAVLDVSEDTLCRACKAEHGITFADYLKQKQEGGRASLRRRQYKLALAGDKTMLVWLGKNWLGQTDKQEIEANVNTESKVIYLPDNGRD